MSTTAEQTTQHSDRHLEPRSDSLGRRLRGQLQRRGHGPRRLQGVRRQAGRRQARGQRQGRERQLRRAKLVGHLLSPDFFDAERFPELRFASKSIERNGDDVTIDGELTLRGVTKPVTITGTVVGPTPDAGASGPIQRIALDIETTVDRREFGIEWNRDLPSGDPALSNDVKITANLALVQA